jgi:hypothetical protein
MAIEYDQIVGVVVDHRKPGSIPTDLRQADPRGPALSRIDIELADELTRWGKFDDLAGLARFGVDRVTIAREQIEVDPDRGTAGAAS